MSQREPIAFMSYVRSDDQHDDGRITRFRERLEGEVRMQTGRSFHIFQDRNDLEWQQEWKARINEAPSTVTFLIPVLTPSFFLSAPCRSEFEAFLLREKTIGVTRLILPIYYVSCDQLEEGYPRGKDHIADILRVRNRTDWRPFRFESLSDRDAGKALAGLAQAIRLSIRGLEEINAVAAANRNKPADQKIADVLAVAAREVPEIDTVARSAIALDPIPEARSAGNFDPEYFKTVTAENRYYSYTRRFDEVINAKDLADNSKLISLDRLLTSSRNVTQLDDLISELDVVIAARKSEPFLSVTILLDNSGSLRGRPITCVARNALRLTECFERWRIRTEVLGYTTRAWTGGQSRQLWLADGKPNAPGRLNDLRHIVYKSFDEGFLATATNFGVMITEDLLRENIDGEALLWAHSRLTQERRSNKFLFVMTDGAPTDDSTLSVNIGNFLEHHLFETVQMIELSGINLIGIGIGHKARCYPKSVCLEAENVGVPVLEAVKSFLQAGG